MRGGFSEYLEATSGEVNVILRIPLLNAEADASRRIAAQRAQKAAARKKAEEQAKANTPDDPSLLPPGSTPENS